MWITNGTIADVAVVWAKLDGVIKGFIVEKGDEGFTAPEMKGKHSLKASVTSELVFQDCKIPKDRILPGVKGLRGPFSCLNNARYGISWGAGCSNGMFPQCQNLRTVKNSIRCSYCFLSVGAEQTGLHAKRDNKRTIASLSFR